MKTAYSINMPHKSAADRYI